MQALRRRMGGEDPLQARITIEVGSVIYSNHVLNFENLPILEALRRAIEEWIDQLEGGQG